MNVIVKQFGASEIIVAAALTWHDAGCSIIPIRADGTKKPGLEWASYMRHRASREEVWNWYRNRPGAGIGIVCGAVSGNLEMLELEGRAATSEDITKINDACEARGVGPLFRTFLDTGYAEWTPSGGIHFLYRIADHDVPGNTKIARRPATDEEIAADMAATGLPIEKINKIKVLAETRGEGGYLVVAPSGGTVHATGDSWSLAAGELGVIPTIGWDERCKLHEAIHAALDEMPQQATPAPRPQLSSLLPSASQRPGDDYNHRVQWIEILGPHGWTVSHIQGHTTYWVRPGKDKRDGHSATTGRAADGDRLYVFSSATVFDAETPYSKFAAYALLEHNGDHAAAARALRGLGYGGSSASAASSYVAGTIEAPAVASSGEPAAHTEAAALVPAAVEGAQAELAPWVHEWSAPTVAGAKIISNKPNYDTMGQMFGIGYKRTFKYVSDKGKWLFFNGKVWTVDRQEAHREGAKELLRRAVQAADTHNATDWIKWTQSASRAASPEHLLKWARSEPGIRAVPEQFDQRRHMITVNNGTIDLDTHTFTAAHDPDLMLTKQLHITYDKDAQCPTWQHLLETVLPDAEMRGYLQRAAGHTLLGDAQERALFLLHGDPGTGKSQVVRVLQLLFGDFSEVAQATTFNDQSKRATITNDLNDLRGKRFVSVAELEEGERLNESLVKRLTGGDTAKSRGLYQENSEWEVQFTLWMMTNFLPRLNSDDAAMWKRVKPIHFPTIVAKNGKEIKKYGEKVFAEEASGILNWLLDGVRAYQEHGLDDLDQITEAVTAYRHNVDSVAQFVEAALDENLIIAGTGQQLGSRQLHHIYQTWCTNNGTRWLGERRFGQRMESLGHERKRAAGGIVWQNLGQGHHGMLGTMNTGGYIRRQ